jgi:hypothetical protein
MPLQTPKRQARRGRIFQTSSNLILLAFKMGIVAEASSVEPKMEKETVSVVYERGAFAQSVVIATSVNQAM